MKIGIIGCGYVFDTYMATWARHPGLVLKGVTDRNPARAEAVARLYGLHRYPTNADLLADPDIDIVVNLTSIDSHYAVNRAALLAGKHVYSEKTLASDMDQARALVALAEAKGLVLACAPSNALCDTTQTMWKAVLDGAVGDVRLVYAELDENPIYLMSPEHWRSRSGAPWPYLHQYEQGCTFEYVGYHLTWLCAIFGPVSTVTAFSKCTLPDKTSAALNPPDTPDFSVACLNFRSGVVARVTCSIGAPYDHRMRIIGNKGMLTADTYRYYRCPVYLERFTKLGLNARKAISVRNNGVLQRVFGVGGRRLRLVRNAPPGAGGQRLPLGGKWWSPRGLKQRELGLQDKCIGIAELADAIASNRRYFPGQDFMLHLAELTFAIQGAGVRGTSHAMTTDFAPVAPMPETLASGWYYGGEHRSSLLTRIIDRILDRMHQKGPDPRPLGAEERLDAR